MPLSDRDYMRPSRQTGGIRRYRRTWGLGLNPVFAIIITNLLFFLAVVFSGEGRYPFGDSWEVISDKFTYYLGLIPYYFPERPWTIVTNMFIHAGFWHFFGNMITFFFFGRALAMLIGHNKLLLVYFVGGIIGNALYLLLGDSLSIAVGASGAVYAIAGALVVIVPTMRVAIWGIIPMPLWVAILVFFVIWSIPGFIPGIAWEAHLGGLVVGLIAGYYFRRKLRYLYILR